MSPIQMQHAALVYLLTGGRCWRWWNRRRRWW